MEKQEGCKYRIFYEANITSVYGDTCNGVDKHNWKIIESNYGIVGYTYSTRWCPVCGALGKFGGFYVEYLQEITLPEQSPFTFDEYNLNEKKEKEKKIKELQKKFLDTVCKESNCGSQRCDGSEEWLEGCKLYKDFMIKNLK